MPRNTLYVRLVKTVNLSVRTFLDRNLQRQAAALTYSTVLALVPAIALLFAIGRGFGFQDLLSASLFQYFPAQHKALETALSFVESYLKEASSGIFVGVGIVVLLWTIISLLSTIEESFNSLWDVKRDRTFYQKFTDYIAICLIVPVLLICSSGVSIFASTIVQSNTHFQFLTPLLNVLLEASPLFLAWLAFTMSYFLIPNTKVQFKYAAISGAIGAVAFQILQLLFVNGQIYVSKYNAIYGTFAFLPLLLVWLQLSFLIVLYGCVLCYSMQNIFAFNFLGDVKRVSPDYHRKVVLIVAAVIYSRFKAGLPPLSRSGISTLYDLPLRMVGDIADALKNAGIVYYVQLPDDTTGYAPAMDTAELSVQRLFTELDALGDTDFIPRFDTLYTKATGMVDTLNASAWQEGATILVSDVPLPSPQAVKDNIESYKE